MNIHSGEQGGLGEFLALYHKDIYLYGIDISKGMVNIPQDTSDGSYLTFDVTLTPFFDRIFRHNILSNEAYS